jgi:alcohol dehydrogenase class IV
LFYNSEVTAEDCNDKRGVNYVKKTMRGLFDILGCNNSTEAFALINKIVSLMGLENDLNRLGILKEHLNEIVNRVNNERLKNNPRTIEKKDLLKLMINT